ncbi:MAG: TIGR03546 family protein [Candidatus Marinimicrobia bacterium]|jgi:uncharacterized protein (TIGR03546 family)|nr:TIGR03546 family protein [Candidatus Neomarinimicrobiota bacterium]MBT3632828.1 TIGR03546 family protein [Candidatus Neomarinimicrobiota bacterium]MBT3681938.1 TIGR03546 family protein [Candidatus Neomarinimicrobiota bacterium]MBT3759033.1 TIGR03546 family protein [Candidatus Neomarinimicrobiota bacterium]MBT3895068.1 TIGR03546 family protein [Candidatus Neomarinimicrobiota bacterium]
MIWLKFFSKLLKALQSGNSPKQLSAGFVLGMFLGMTPFLSLFSFIIIIITIILNVNISMFILGSLIFGIIGYIIDPLFHHFGYFLLIDVPALESLWIICTNTPLLSLLRFNNTTNLGSIVTSFTFSIPVYFATIFLVKKYRTRFGEKVNKLKITKIIKGSKLYSIYQKITLVG